VEGFTDSKQQAPAIRDDCEQNECKEPAKHFKHCAEKVRNARALRRAPEYVASQVLTSRLKPARAGRARTVLRR
jgi:hypothetical protein